VLDREGLTLVVRRDVHEHSAVRNPNTRASHTYFFAFIIIVTAVVFAVLTTSVIDARYNAYVMYIQECNAL
jgi:hypothetical protein